MAGEGAGACGGRGSGGVATAGSPSGGGGDESVGTGFDTAEPDETALAEAGGTGDTSAAVSGGGFTVGSFAGGPSVGSDISIPGVASTVCLQPVHSDHEDYHNPIRAEKLVSWNERLMPAPSTAVIVLFQQDLRLADNPALAAAVQRGGPVIPVFLWSPTEEGAWTPGAASRAWLHRSLESLSAELKQHDSRLIVRQGASLDEIRALLSSSKAGAVFWNRRYEPAARARDAHNAKSLENDGVDAQTFNAQLLNEPDEIRNKAGEPFRVFTPYWRNVLGRGDPAFPTPTPKQIPAPESWPRSVALEHLELEPRIPWHRGMLKDWTPGTQGAKAAVERFLEQAFADYAEGRDRPDQPGTSQLSVHLHFGEVGPRQVWHAVRRFATRKFGAKADEVAEPFLRQIIWREFAHHLLHHYPHTPDEPLREQFAEFPWLNDRKALRAWQRGMTGYPIVDAGMRQLWGTGWMHNRVRMIVGSFLVKDLLLPWQDGAKWFWDTLVDADLANNTLGWQWIAGCGADAAPYFRVFNPMSQGEKFDPEGRYVREWVPELSRVPNHWIHAPWTAPTSVLAEAGVELGKTYPEPLVDHKQARERALKAFGTIRRGG